MDAPEQDAGSCEARSEMARRRALLQCGVKPVEVARRLEASRTSVFRWEQALAVNEPRTPRTGRPPQLSETEKKRLVSLEAGCRVPVGPLETARDANPKDFTELSAFARAKLQVNPAPQNPRCCPFWKQAELPF
jgi:hypothetical protein